MPQITAPLRAMQDLFGALNPYRSTDEVTPVITAFSFETRDEKLVAITTDRYMIGEYTLGEIKQRDDVLTFYDVPERWMVPGDVAMFVRSVSANMLLMPKSVADYMVRVEQLADSVGGHIIVEVFHREEKIVEISRRFRGMSGHYPPVHKLFPDDEPVVGVTHVALSPKFLERLAKSTRAAGRSNSMVEFRMYAPDNESTKPKPILIVFDELPLRVMLQPFIRTRS